MVSLKSVDFLTVYLPRIDQPALSLYSPVFPRAQTAGSNRPEREFFIFFVITPVEYNAATQDARAL